MSSPHGVDMRYSLLVRFTFFFWLSQLPPLRPALLPSITIFGLFALRLRSLCAAALRRQQRCRALSLSHFGVPNGEQRMSVSVSVSGCACECVLREEKLGTLFRSYCLCWRHATVSDSVAHWLSALFTFFIFAREGEGRQGEGSVVAGWTTEWRTAGNHFRLAKFKLKFKFVSGSPCTHRSQC